MSDDLTLSAIQHITLDSDEMGYAWELFRNVDWDAAEAGLPDGARDKLGDPIDRHNQYLRVSMLAECIGTASGWDAGTGIDLLNAPTFETFAWAALDAYDAEACS